VWVCVACVPIDGFFIPNPAHCFAGLVARIFCYAAISYREIFEGLTIQMRGNARAFPRSRAFERERRGREFIRELQPPVCRYCDFTLTSSITNEVWLELSSTP